MSSSIDKSLFEFAECTLCKSRNATIQYWSRDLITKSQGIFFVVQCNQCGLVRTQPRPRESDISYFYPSDYGPYKLSKISNNEKITSSSKKSRLRRFFQKVIFDLVKKPRTLPSLPQSKIKLLDYGCASGQYLISLDSQKFERYGVDFSSDSLENASRLGLNVYSEPLSKEFFPKDNFDIITAWMVLEHLYDPKETLSKLRYWLSNDGYLVLSVPDHATFHKKLFRGMAYDNHVPQHVNHFTIKTLNNLLHICGLETVEYRWQPNSRTLFQSINNVFHYKLSSKASQIFSNLISTNNGKRFQFLMGYLLALFRQSGRLEVVARKLL